MAVFAARAFETIVPDILQPADVFLDRYLETEGASILSAVGCYRLEGQGVQLFHRIKGDYFSILGLPLLPLLAELRKRDVIAK